MGVGTPAKPEEWATAHSHSEQGPYGIQKVHPTVAVLSLERPNATRQAGAAASQTALFTQVFLVSAR